MTDRHIIFKSYGCKAKLFKTQLRKRDMFADPPWRILYLNIMLNVKSKTMGVTGNHISIF